jgi:hypothetical protein
VPDAGSALIQSALRLALHAAQDPSFGVTVTVTVRSLPSEDTVHVSMPTSGALALNVYVHASASRSP